MEVHVHLFGHVDPIKAPSHLDNKLLEIQIHGHAFVMMSKKDITFKEYLHAPKLPKK
jgi:hypothetical protein